MSDTPAYIPRNRLPETYGEGERQYDMATAALGAAESVAWPLSVLSACLAWQAWSPWVAVPAALAVYFIALYPYKKALKRAQTLWAQDDAAYQALFRRPVEDGAD